MSKFKRDSLHTRAPKRPRKPKEYFYCPGYDVSAMISDQSDIIIEGYGVKKPLALAYWLIRAQFYLDAKRKGGGK